MLKVNELFYSLQGDTSYMGYPCVIIRLTGCNLRCRYCDTQYAYTEGKEYSIEKIISFISRFRTNLVMITGGEPLLQKKVVTLTERLITTGYKVLIETNGSLPINILPDKVVRIMDIKCPGSGMSKYMLWENINYLKKEDEVKFVILDYNDYNWAKDVINRYGLLKLSKVLFSPVFKKLDLRMLADWILKDELNVRLQPQLHKIIWGEKRGV
ncbi:MAG TPA: radical SAM protein [Candidatus Desulfofervidus auxilii]|uniref:7-carboxy-7-deazaguanine synthase n=1 Tax=Desulfofervidus auxilii TaxID=1621989 RepID=A0A7V0IA88_DESA2|nr:radical SAM protein [Candidatus Desulfofervidus auxilii]